MNLKLKKETHKNKQSKREVAYKSHPQIGIQEQN